MLWVENFFPPNSHSPMFVGTYIIIIHLSICSKFSNSVNSKRATNRHVRLEQDAALLRTFSRVLSVHSWDEGGEV
jgi:hypothetical protein